MKMVEERENKLDPQQVIDEFELLSKDAGKIQEKTLQKILEENGRTEYLQQWGLNGNTDQVSFNNCVPLVTHWSHTFVELLMVILLLF